MTVTVAWNAAQKCAHLDCARDAVRAYRGGHRPGRPPEGSGPGVRYCHAHYEQLRRGRSETGPIRPRGATGGRRAAIDDCADIAELHGHAELAALLRRLE